MRVVSLGGQGFDCWKSVTLSNHVTNGRIRLPGTRASIRKITGGSINDSQ